MAAEQHNGVVSHLHGYSLNSAYARYSQIASHVLHAKITGYPGFMPDQFPAICINIVNEAGFAREHAPYTGMPAFTTLGLTDAAAIIGGIYQVERETGNTTTYVTFPKNVQALLEGNKMLSVLQADMRASYQGGRRSPWQIENVRRVILAGFFERAIGQKRAELEGKFGGWEEALNDYTLGVALILTRWQHVSTQA